MMPRASHAIVALLGWLSVGCMLPVLAAGAVKAGDASGPARDRFGDPLPAGAIARLGTVRLRHADYLYAIAFAPDGKTVVSTGRDGVRVWDAATGKPVRHFGAGVLPRSVSLSPDGRRIALSRYHAGEGGPVDVWDVATGKLLHKLGNRHYSLVCFSPDSKRLAALAGIHNPVQDADVPWQIDVWDAATGRRLSELTGPKEYISDMKFSADGKTLLLGGSSKAISIRDAASGKEIRRIRDLSADVHTMVLSPRGDRAAFMELLVSKAAPGSGSWGPGERLFLLDTRTGAELRRWTVKEPGPTTRSLWGLAWSPDGKRLAACEMDGPVRIWDVATGKEVRHLADGRTHSGGLAFSPDGQSLAVGDGGRTIRLIDAGNGAERVKAKGHRGGVTALAVAADGRTVFAATDGGTIHRWDARTGHELGRLTGHKERVTDLALSADGRTLCSVSHDRTLRDWNLDSGKERRLLEDQNVYWARLALSPDGETLAVPVNYKELLLLRPATGKTLHKLATKTQIITFAANASVVTALTGDRTIWRWETATGRRLPDLSLPLDRDEPPITHPDSSYGGGKVVLSPDGRLVAHAYDDKFLRILDVETQREVHRTAKLSGNVSTIAFAPDGRTLAWGEQSGVVHWIELASWSERRALPGHAGPVARLAFSADGRLLVSGSDDATALVWDLLGRGPATLPDERLSACWRDLADKDAARAHGAMRSLIAAPADALAYFRPRLKPAGGVDERRIERLIADLDADAFAVREKAAEELRKLGELAEPACRKALASRPTLEKRRRLQGLLDDISSWRPSLEVLRQWRVIEVLECIGTPEARALLEALARGAAGARLTREARAALHRLTHRAGERK